MSTTKISKHISYKEAVVSATATRRNIKNVPNEKQLKAMQTLAKKVFEPLRVHFDKPIRVNSFFRSVALNKTIGGSATSQHCKGEAIDIDATAGVTNKQLYNYIKDNLEFDQLIWEFGTDKEPDWVHVSYTTSKPNRNQLLRASKKRGKSVYTVIENKSKTEEKKTGTVKVKTFLNVREKASAEAKKVGALKNGEIVTVFKEEKGWLKIKTAKIEGWASGKYIVVK
ncbi:MAG: SH3 domain-containing protein [Vicingus serpentipes]|nr:SH3 domain-containing protein [Vicingus serpentipes]